MSFPQSRLALLLSQNPKLEGAVKLSFERLRPWIESSKQPFFPEYTDHGWTHISEVVSAFSGLISDKSWTILTASDAAIAYMGVLFHDCAMHLDEDAFIAIRNDTSIKLEKGDLTWVELWNKFEAEAKRYDGKKLKKLFGSSDPVSSIPSREDEFTKRDRLLIGEFIRLHHPRLAQQIAVYGIPSSSTPKLQLDDIWGEDRDLLALAGIVARSHGVELRKAIKWTNHHHDAKQYRGCHPTFLMVALRIADYIQLHRERAPGQVLQIKRFSSPLSKREWATHNAVIDIRNTHEDPEAIFIDAQPKSIDSFLKLESLIEGLQVELDNCWAVMGEVYGRIEGLNQLGIVIRRVRSSLEDIDGKTERFDYIPMAASFASADADLLKLLIEPLYGNRPEVGIRELLQNSVDATRERVQLESQRGILPEQQISPKVTLEIYPDGEIDVLKVSDNGIGMTPEIVIKYFLTAGASFRRSDDWRKNFEDSEGNTTVLRAGRFGIGALAAFLIGPEITVITRHQNEVYGLRFTASVDDDNIELKRINCDVGTVVFVSLSETSSATLRGTNGLMDLSDKVGSIWDWYCDQLPVVERYIDGVKLEQSVIFKKSSPEARDHWRQFSTRDYPEIRWTFSDVPFLVCNGFKVIIKRSHRHGQHKIFRENALDVPNVSVVDPNGIFPLNLQRSDIVDSEYPFEQELLQSVAADFVAFAQKILVSKKAEIDPLQINVSHAYPGSGRVNSSWAGSSQAWNDWYLTNDGFGYLHRDLINARGYSSAYVMFPASESVIVRNFEDFADFFVSLPVDGTVGGLENRLRSLFSIFLWPEIDSIMAGNSALEELKRMKWDSILAFVGKEVVDRFIDGGKLPQYMRDHAEFEPFEGGAILTLGDVGPIMIESWKSHISNDVKLVDRSFVAVLHRELKELPRQASVIVQEWLDKVGNKEICFMGAK